MLEVVRLSFPEYAQMPTGIPFLQRYENPLHARHILGKYPEHVRVLDIGSYNLTPPTWKHNEYNHHLRVFEGGIAVYRMDPRVKHASVEVAVNVGFGLLFDSLKGRKTFSLPQDTSSIMLGARDNHGEMRVYEVISVREA